MLELGGIWTPAPICRSAVSIESVLSPDGRTHFAQLMRLLKYHHGMPSPCQSDRSRESSQTCAYHHDFESDSCFPRRSILRAILECEAGLVFLQELRGVRGIGGCGERLLNSDRCVYPAAGVCLSASMKGSPVSSLIRRTASSKKLFDNTLFFVPVDPLHLQTDHSIQIVSFCLYPVLRVFSSSLESFA